MALAPGGEVSLSSRPFCWPGPGLCLRAALAAGPGRVELAVEQAPGGAVVSFSGAGAPLAAPEGPEAGALLAALGARCTGQDGALRLTLAHLPATF